MKNICATVLILWFSFDLWNLWNNSRLIGFDSSWVLAANISGMEEASIADYPYMVAIYYKRGFMIQRCTGTFLTNRFILTSGICYEKFFKGADRRVAIINSATPNDDFDNNDQIAEIECGFLHPGYQGSEKPDDLAILRLKDKVDTSKGFGVVCVPPAKNECKPPKDCFAVLYSIANGDVKLNKANMELIHSHECKADFGHLDNTKQICAKIKTENRANSLLNSGAALMCKVQDQAGKDTEIQLGIVNYDFDSVANRYPGVFIHAPYYRDWIEEMVESHKNSC